MPIRVLQVLTTNARRGAETSALLLRDELARRGLATRAVALAPAATGARHEIPTLGRRRLAVPTLRALRHQGRAVDVVIAHGSTTLPACAIALAGSRIPFVYANIGDLDYWAGRGARRLRTRLLLRKAAAVAARSPRSARTLVDRFGVPATKVHVVPNGRPADHFTPADPTARATARARFGLPPDGPVIAWVGALSPEKRPDLAVRAAAELDGARLLMAGDGPLRTAIHDLGETNLPRRLHLVGALDDVTPVYAAADVLLLTSDSEGLPGVLIEAGLAGLPTVATRVGFVDDVVVEPRTGRLAPPGDVAALTAALRAALADRERIGAAARQHCLQRFSLAAVGTAWERLLTDIAGK